MDYQNYHKHIKIWVQLNKRIYVKGIMKVIPFYFDLKKYLFLLKYVFFNINLKKSILFLIVFEIL